MTKMMMMMTITVKQGSACRGAGTEVVSGPETLLQLQSSCGREAIKGLTANGTRFIRPDNDAPAKGEKLRPGRNRPNSRSSARQRKSWNKSDCQQQRQNQNQKPRSSDRRQNKFSVTIATDDDGTRSPEKREPGELPKSTYIHRVSFSIRGGCERSICWEVSGNSP